MFRSILAIVAILSLSLSASGLYKPSDDKQYFPQQVGDEHVYRKSGRLAQEGAGWTDKITNKEGKFYEHSNYWGDGEARWLRAASNGNVFERAKRPLLWYRLSEGQDAEWILSLSTTGPPCIGGARLKITSHIDIVKVPAGEFQNCLKVEFQSNCSDAGVTEQWFAPGVGLVKQIEQSIAGPIISELVSAKVGAITYPK